MLLFCKLKLHYIYMLPEICKFNVNCNLHRPLVHKRLEEHVNNTDENILEKSTEIDFPFVVFPRMSVESKFRSQRRL